MKEIMMVTKELERRARKIADFRSDVKAYLLRHDACLDKFTVTGNDSFLGYVSETAVSAYLKKQYGERVEISCWSDRFDLASIDRAVRADYASPGAVRYIKKYFYDEWDLKITEKKSGESVFVDVKTAETEKSPQHYWNFLYPVIQNQRSGKDYVVLCYYYKTAQFPRIILAGYIPEAEIAQKPVLKAGTRTRFGTLNQIDNYETRLTDYHPIAGLIDYLTKGRDLL